MLYEEAPFDDVMWCRGVRQQFHTIIRNTHWRAGPESF
jgi:hypothetical protein